MHVDFVSKRVPQACVKYVDVQGNCRENMHSSYWEESYSIAVECEKDLRGKNLRGWWWRAIVFKSFFSGY